MNDNGSTTDESMLIYDTSSKMCHNNRKKYNQLGLHIAYEAAKVKNSNFYNKNFVFNISNVMNMLWIISKSSTIENRMKDKNRKLLNIFRSTIYFMHHTEKYYTDKNSILAIITDQKFGRLAVNLNIEIPKIMNVVYCNLKNQGINETNDEDSGCEDCMDLSLFEIPVNEINEYMKTKSNIQELVDFTDIRDLFTSTSTVMSMISKSECKGKWKHPFTHHTFIGTFHTSTNSTCQAEMMTVKCPHLEFNKMSGELKSIIVRFKYDNNNALIICMPSKIANYIELLLKIDYLMQAYKFEQLLNSFAKINSTYQQIPKFSFQMEHKQVRQILQRIDDLSSLVSNNLKLSNFFTNLSFFTHNITHKIIASVTNFEHGTIAHEPGTTTQKLSTTNLPDVSIKQNDIRINRPFIFIIMDKSNHIIDFGIFMKPPPLSLL